MKLSGPRNAALEPLPRRCPTEQFHQHLSSRRQGRCEVPAPGRVALRGQTWPNAHAVAAPELGLRAASGGTWRLQVARCSQGRTLGHWAPSHCLGCASEPPPRLSIRPPVSTRWRCVGESVHWAGQHVEGAVLIRCRATLTLHQHPGSITTYPGLSGLAPQVPGVATLRVRLEAEVRPCGPTSGADFAAVATNRRAASLAARSRSCVWRRATQLGRPTQRARRRQLLHARPRQTWCT